MLKINASAVAIALLTTALFSSTPVAAHDVPASEQSPSLNFDQVIDAFGWDFDNVALRSEQLSDELTVIYGIGGNIAVLTTEEGTLLVDNQFARIGANIRETLDDIGAGEIRYVLNTHGHFDHADGNLEFAKDEQSIIIAHDESRVLMAQDTRLEFGIMNYTQPAYPEYALPKITFNDQMSLYFGDQTIELMHKGNAHTNGDAVVFFKEANALHTGDVFVNAGYPFIDVDNGGSIRGLIEFVQVVYTRIDDQTKIIPGHGPTTDRAKMAKYIAMLQDMEQTVTSLVEQGASLEQVLAAQPSKDYDAVFSSGPASTSSFLSRVFSSVKKAQRQAGKTKQVKAEQANGD